MMSQWLSGLSFAYEGARSEMAYIFSVGYAVGEWLLTLKQGSLAQPLRVLRTEGPSSSGSHLVSATWS